jgi:hypothetical protein
VLAPFVAPHGHPDAPLSSSPPRRRCTNKHSKRALHVAPFAAAPLRRVSTRALLPCRPVNSFLSLGAAHIASTQCTAIKGGHPWCLVRASTVSTSFLWILTLRRCQATSPYLSPRAQVLELRQSPELLPNPKNQHLPHR